MLILGKHTEDKGNQLERLTHDLLSLQGYRNVIQSEILAGGSEVDVSAEFMLPGLGEGTMRRLLCECKATQAAIDSTQWMKFLGKVFSEEKLHKQEVFGTLIALNGVNGNVWGHFNTLKQHGISTIKLVQGSDLLDLIRRLEPMPSFEQVASLVKRLIGRAHESLDIAYYEKRFCWVVLFNSGQYSLLAPGGGALDAAMAALVQPLVEKEVIAHVFVDIHAEAAALKAKRGLMSSVLGLLISRCGSASQKDVLEELEGHTQDEMREAVESLSAEGFVKRDADWVSITGQVDGQVSDPKHRVKLLRFMLEGGLVVKAIGSPMYDQMVDEALLTELCDVQGGFLH